MSVHRKVQSEVSKSSHRFPTDFWSLESRSFQGFSSSTRTFSRIYFIKYSLLRSPQEEWSSHKIMERPYKIFKNLASYQIRNFQGLYSILTKFKDFQGLENEPRISRIFKDMGALKK